MSYIVAFVTFLESDKKFPVQCYRTDLIVSDEVIVRRVDGKLRNAIITHLQYLNWDCNGRIECKKSESTLDNYGEIIVPKGAPLVFGISTADAFIKALRAKGWIPVKSRQRMYKSVLANLNDSHVAYIFVRKNGLDLRVFLRTEHEQIKPYSLYDRSLSDGREVRHSLAHTNFNLYEGMLRFSASFLSNESDLERYFVPYGSTDKRTDEMKKQAELNKNNELSDEYSDDTYSIYNAFSDGSGEPVYLGDGMWVSANGNMNDWGR